MLEHTYLVATKRPLSIIIANDAEISPTIPNLTGQIERAGEYPAAQGANAEIWTGEWVQSRSSRKVEAPLHKQAIAQKFSLGQVSVRILRTFRKENGGLREKMWPKVKKRSISVSSGAVYVLALASFTLSSSLGKLRPSQRVVAPWHQLGL
jgi:hypothetical protein